MRGTNALMARALQRADHRAWLKSVKRACERCGQTNYAALRIVDRETGEGNDINGRHWWLHPDKRAEVMDRSEVLCATCHTQDKKSRGLLE